MTRILVIEDDADIRDLIVYHLEKERFSVSTAASGRAGVESALARFPDLVILDLMLPDQSGYEVCRRLRSERATRHLPIIMLTARSAESDVVLGLELGADDYMRKPFSTRELLSRVRAVLRRGGPREACGQELLRLGEVELDPVRHEVRVQNRGVDVTPAEFRLLKKLMSQPGRVFSRDRLLDEITEGQVAIIDRNVDVHIRGIRKKLGPAAGIIRTVRGVGYRSEES